MATIDVNGTTLYYERRGDGPPLLFISGATGDAGHWTDVADALAGEYTVISYDRRANSRSPRPENYARASITEQADDAAALLEGLELTPAVAYGNSAGAMILTDLVVRRPDLLRGAVLHEPPFAGMTSHGDEVVAGLQQLIADGMAQGGPARATELFLRWVCGDEVYESFEPALRDRMLGNGEVLFGIELEPIMSYVPTRDQLAGVRIPCVVASGAENRDPASPRHWFWEASQWAADGLGVPLTEAPGAHVPQSTHPQELAALLRPVLARLAASSPVTA
ncbi:alpha/beta hydrolase [Actinomycetospora sp. NBRC 106375]|uniref:alpha/beta fold hydrolase n=1 Tax=Actinomycetospora sp. NBRC 106375 TaxID=3032207 RepID=UPI0024A27FB9|nr:alpha/beta hydrolase [Actinomycetospora sp. NBRC 106375]GLZ45638.1 alpha/beta hydrolase [Actinomycetospora sp. NBRC 106375]